MIDFGNIGGSKLDPSAFSSKASNAVKRYIMPKRMRPVPKHKVKYDNAAEMASDLAPNIAGGDTVTAILSGNFIFGDIFEAFAYETGMPIDELTISTLSFSDENIVSLSEMLKSNKIGTLNILISDYFWSHNRNNASYIYERLDIGGRFQLAVGGVHTKISLIKAGSRKIVISGSANLRSSRCIESVTFETDSGLYDFHHKWHMDVIEEYKTINKSVRAGAAYQAIKGY